MREAYFAPFTRDTGIEVVEQTYGSQGLARVKAQLREGAARVDLLDGAPFWPVIGHRQQILDAITLTNVDASSFIAGAIGPYSFGYATVSWGITRLSTHAARPNSWRDFWDARRFPGRRALFGPFVARHPEYALMADGVPPHGVNPLDEAKIERAFAKLAGLKPAVSVWYQTAAQCEHLLANNQVDMVEFFNGRAFFLKDQGVPLEFVWNQAIMNTSVFVLARQAPNRENALAFLEYIAQPEPQAAYAKLICYGPTNTRALQLIADPKTLERLPTFGPNRQQQIALDARWWSEQYDRLSPRWSRLISS
jgi:putative spermidine/putrescine transport system substrate-binding protein